MQEKYKNKSYSPHQRTIDLLSRMTVEEKIGQMCQVDGRKSALDWIHNKHIGSFLHVTGTEINKLQLEASKTRLQIPIIFGIDAIHGHAFQSGATVFPSQLALSCSWNRELLKEVARITAREVIATGLHWTFSPVLCIGRDPRWGRIGETFGEDPYLIGELAAAMVRGYQGDKLSDEFSILSCAKHFAAYGESLGGRDSAEAEVSRRKLLSIFLPPFENSVKHGCRTIMAGYNSIDGIPCSANKWLLKDCLRGEWQFDGFVVSDWDNCGHLHRTQKVAKDMEQAVKLMINCGNDMIMSTPEFYDIAVKLVKKKEIDKKLIDDSVYRILRAKFELGLFDDKRYIKAEHKKELGKKEYRPVALQTALESIVLLKNDGVLPLDIKKLKKIAVVGPNIDDVQSQLGDWTFGAREFEYVHIPTLNYHPEYDASNCITIKKAFEDRLGSLCELKFIKGCDVLSDEIESLDEIIKQIEDVDAVIAVVGDTNTLNGEIRDRAELNLSKGQMKLLKALKGTQKKLIAVIMSGKPLTIPWIKENCDAIINAFNPGMEGGNAVFDIIFGNYNPSGKLTISYPKHIGQLPVYYNSLPGWHTNSYVEIDDKPLFPFGYGLSYTKFEYSNMRIDEEMVVSVDVKNVGSMDGREIVQLYVNDVYSSVVTPIKELKGFEIVDLKMGEKKTVQIAINISDLSIVNSQLKRVVEEGEFEIMIGSSSQDEDLLKKVIEI